MLYNCSTCRCLHVIALFLFAVYFVTNRLGKIPLIDTVSEHKHIQLFYLKHKCLWILAPVLDSDRSDNEDP